MVLFVVIIYYHYISIIKLCNNSCLFLKKFLVTWQLSIKSPLQTQDDVVDSGDRTPKHPEYHPR